MELFGQGIWRFIALLAPDRRSAVNEVGCGSLFGWLDCAGQILCLRVMDQPKSGFLTDLFGSGEFVALGAAASFYVFFLSYASRLRRIPKQIRSEMRPRLHEREKSHHETHDALLQAIQGLLLRFQTISDHLATLQRSRLALDEVMNSTDELIVDSRDNIGKPRLRDSDDLPDLLLGLADGLAFGPPIDVWMTVEGLPRDIQPAAHEVIKRIATEALRNSFCHAQADNIEICIVYQRRQLVVQLRDDGIGVDQVELDRRGMPGHFGLLDMKTRAHRLGGHYSVSSRKQAGTVVQLRLPTKVAYRLVAARAA